MANEQEIVKQHKDAFRAAFDFLNLHYPPGLDPDWWVKAAKDASAVCAEHKGNRLAVCLIGGVYDYLDMEAKEMGYDGTGTEH